VEKHTIINLIIYPFQVRGSIELLNITKVIERILSADAYIFAHRILVEKHTIINLIIYQFQVRGSLILLKIKRRLYNG